MICDAFLIHINPIKFALLFVEHFVYEALSVAKGWLVRFIVQLIVLKF